MSWAEHFAGHAVPWTEQEWAALPESMGRVELLVVSPFPAVSHQRLVRNLARSPVPGLIAWSSPMPMRAPVSRLPPDRAGTELGAISYSLAPNGFVVSARSAGGRLTLKGPFPADLDLAALGTATRYPGHGATWQAKPTNLHCVGP